jgi:galactokinase
MDHAASLASRAGCASLIRFEPVSVEHIPIPAGWAFLVAHSGHTAEKSGAVRERYNAVRAAGTEALLELGFASYAEAVAKADLSGVRQKVFLHVVTEARRVVECVEAMSSDQPERFGRLLLDSHASLRDRLEVSCPELDRLVEAAMESGALGARLTGAGFGGCAVVLCRREDVGAVREGLERRFYRSQAGRPALLFEAEAGAGAVHS